jgi:SAM-dependent methyltransferase
MTNDAEAQRKLTGKFLRTIMDAAAGTIAIRLCTIGDHLDLFKDLAENGPTTSQELADRTGLQERYLREWIYGITAAGYLDFDKASRQVSIPPAHVPVLAEEGGALFQGGMFNLLAGALRPYDELLDAFRNGGGIDYATYGDEFWSGLERGSCVRYTNLLVSQWLPHMPDIAAKLEAGGSFADYGCGTGQAMIELATSYPNARFLGLDIFPPNVEKGREKAAAAGVADRVSFEVGDLSNHEPGSFDVVSALDLIHDIADPINGMKTLRRALKDDGLFMLMDIECEEDPADNEGPLAVFKLGASLHYCMTTALAQDGLGLGTVGLPESKVREFAEIAGFSSVRRVPIDHALNSMFELRP